jgi:DNA-binding response OmpR family regulator
MKKKKIIIVDDDTAILDAIQLMLEDAGYDAESKVDGEIMPELYEQKPDLLLLDLWLSGVDGREICKKIKNDTKLKDIPIIIISANKDTKQIAREAGAEDFIEKPFQMHDLLSKVAKYTKKSHK